MHFRKKHAQVYVVYEVPPTAASGSTLCAVLTHPSSKQTRTMGINMQVPPPHPQESLQVLGPWCAQQVGKTEVSLGPSAGFPGDLEQLSILTVPECALLETGDFPLPASQRGDEDG